MSLSPLVLAEGPAVNLAHQDLLSGQAVSLLAVHSCALLSEQETSKTQIRRF
jgi:hypothetical protein